MSVMPNTKDTPEDIKAITGQLYKEQVDLKKCKLAYQLGLHHESGKKHLNKSEISGQKTGSPGTIFCMITDITKNTY